jgi:hypothetical protein
METKVTTQGLLWDEIQYDGSEIGHAVQRLCQQYEAEQKERLGPRYGFDDMDVRVVFNDAFRLGYLLASGRYTPEQLLTRQGG